MKYVELVPFRDHFQGFGGNNSDSVVGLIKGQDGPVVLKWSRTTFATPEEAFQAALFLRRSIALLQTALGKEVIVPTSVIVAQKRDNRGPTTRVFITQPFVEGWTARDCPPAEIAAARP